MDNFFAFLYFAFGALHEFRLPEGTCMMGDRVGRKLWTYICTHGIVVSRTGKGATEFRDLARSFVDDDDIAGEYLFFR